MVEQLERLAWEILRDIASQVVDEHGREDPRTQLEIARLSALNSVLTPWNLRNGVLHTSVEFKRTSNRLRLTGLTQDDLAARRLRRSAAERVLHLDKRQLVTLLTQIHSIGRYRLPLDLDFGTLQRDLGAYYTPVHVADFIVEAALNHLSSQVAPAGDSLALGDQQRILDPACGTGVFLLSAYSNLKRAYEERGHSLEEDQKMNEALLMSLYGVDLDQCALEIAEVSLQLYSGLSVDLGANLRQGNSLVSINGLDGEQDYSEFFSEPDEKQAFEWQDEFPVVLAGGGFDCVLMNPPYQRLKPNFAEFLRERLLSGEKKIHTEEFESHKQVMAEESTYFRDSGEYSYSNRFTLNTYQLFLERALQLVRQGGVIGCIVPSSVLGDQSAQSMREELLVNNNVHSVYEFLESSKIFQGVTQSVSILVLEKGGGTRTFEMSYGLDSIQNTEKAPSVSVSSEQIFRLLGTSAAIPRLSSVGWSILELMQRYPSLSEFDGAQVWRGELDLSINKGCISSSDTGYPLIRGSDVGRFRLRRGKPRSFADADCLRSSLGASRRLDHMDRDRIATQQVSNMNQRWRLKCSLVRKSQILANSCNYISLANKGTGVNDLWYLLGLLNSELLNWRFHLASFNNHVSIRELRALPVVQPSRPEEMKLYETIVSEARTLTSSNEPQTRRLDASVFKLYGLSSRSARHVLKSRNTPEPTLILRALKDLE